MKLKYVIPIAAAAVLAVCCAPKQDIISENVENAKIQLKSLVEASEAGDTVTYTTSAGTRTYEVETVRKIGSNDWSYLEPTSDNRITMITCVSDDYSVRWMVQAVETN